MATAVEGWPSPLLLPESRGAGNSSLASLPLPMDLGALCQVEEQAGSTNAGSSPAGRLGDRTHQQGRSGEA